MEVRAFFFNFSDLFRKYVTVTKETCSMQIGSRKVAT